MDTADQVAFLAASPERAAMLEALYPDDRLSRDELVEACGAARVTVGRNLERLGERGLVAESAEGSRLTPLGELLVGEFLSLLETAAAAEELAPLLRRLPPGEFDLDPAALVGASVTVATETDPYAPARAHAAATVAASEVRLLLPTVSTQPIEATADSILSGELDLEVVVTPAVAETLRSEDFADRIEQLRAAETMSVYLTESDIPFFVGLVDDAVQIGVTGDSGVPEALAQSDDPTVREWARGRYEEYRAAAVPFDAYSG